MAEAARERVERLLAVARRVAAPGEALGREARAGLLAQGILSAEGIELALSQHLETSADEASFARLLATAEPAPRCHVVLSANVCTGALRALAVALAGSPRVLVRPSRRDPVLARLFARELPDLVTCVAELAPLPGELVHVYGRDETIAELAASLPEGARLRAHGAGFGLALIEADDALEAAADGVAADVVPFDQAGCLSPRFVLVAGDTERALAFGEHLHRALARLGERVPRAPLGAAMAAAVTGYRATASALGELFEGPHHGVAVRVEGRGLLLPPAARVVLVAAASAASAVAEVAPLARFVTAVGARGGALSDALLTLAPNARRSALGAMQRPPLDGPVDLRPLAPPAPSRCAASGAEQG